MNFLLAQRTDVVELLRTEYTSKKKQNVIVVHQGREKVPLLFVRRKVDKAAVKQGPRVPRQNLDVFEGVDLFWMTGPTGL